MHRLVKALQEVHESEEGHAIPAVASLGGAVGAVLLGFGAAGDNDALAIIGGFVAGVGFLAGAILEHVNVDYKIFDRLERLEKK